MVVVLCNDQLTTGQVCAEAICIFIITVMIFRITGWWVADNKEWFQIEENSTKLDGP